VTIVLTKPQISSDVEEKQPITSSEAFEFIISCPKCRTLETVWLAEDGQLIPTRKFSQSDGHIYHDCGSIKPCQLYHLC